MAAVVFSFAGISVILKKAFWARHLSPVFPVYVLLIYGVLHFLLKEREWIIGRILGILLIVLLLFSSFQVVCSRSYSRDDYRGAAQRAIVTLQQGGTVWWAGSWHCGAYYGLPIAEGLSTLSRLILIQNPTKDMLLSEATPDLILLSRQDVYDGYNNVSAYALVNHFHQSKQTPYLFHLWERHE